MFWLLSDTLCAALEPAGLSWLYFALMGTLALLLGLIGSALMTYPTLYAARDNEFLLSLPIPPGTILLARMTGLYLLTLFFQVLVLLPAGIVYARYAGLTAGGAASWLVALGLPHAADARARVRRGVADRARGGACAPPQPCDGASLDGVHRRPISRCVCG